jgi:hypothetical protein
MGRRSRLGLRRVRGEDHERPGIVVEHHARDDRHDAGRFEREPLLHWRAVPSLPVKPEFGPSLPELAGPRWRRLPAWLRLGLAALAALVVVLVVLAVTGRGADERSVVVTEPVAFNLRHATTLTRVAPAGPEMLRLEQRRDGRRVGSFAVRPLRLPAYRGSVAGAYPIYAERIVAELRARFADFELADEGRVRINEAPGYGVGFRARQDGRRVWGRTVLVVPETDPPEPVRDGVRMDLVASPGSGVSNPADVGAVGGLKLPLRSFRFGTEAP